MPTVEDGTIAGVLPESQAFAVHYPGYPSSTSRAIDTLGGTDEIAKRRSADAKYIELRFRPEDPYSHPAFGDRRASNNLLLRVSKKKTCSETRLCANVVARVREAYHFDGMADYQYVLPVHAAKAKHKRRWVESEPDNENSGLMDFEHDDLLMLVPPLFSLKDIPEDLVLKATPALVSKQLQRGSVELNWEMGIEPCLALPFTTEKIPEKVAWEDNLPKDTAEWECQMAVSKLFDERPIWPRQSLYERLVDDGQHVSENQYRRLLYRSGYYFSTGPFGKFWIRKGYDPRTDSQSRKYQKVDFRIPGKVRKVANDIAKNRSNTKWKDICQFQAIPSKTFTCLQLFELQEEYIQQEIGKPAAMETCTYVSGWLSENMLELLRLHVKKRFLSMMHGSDALEKVRDAMKQIQRIKIAMLDGEVDPYKKHSNQKGLVPDEEPDPDEGLPVSRDPLDHESEVADGLYNLQPVRDGEEEHHDFQVEDNEDEEFDECEFPSVDEGDGYSLNRSSYNIGEDISNDYLHEILSGFNPSKGKEHQFDESLQDAESDGEYQIFEQDSDEDE